MDTIHWFFIFLIILLFVALLLPAQYPQKPVQDMKKTMEDKRLRERKPTCEVIGPCARPCKYSGLNAEKNRYNHRAEIDSQFILPSDTIPNDYPEQGVGCCPYSRPFSKDLPVADAPMYKATAQDNMYLRL